MRLTLLATVAIWTTLTLIPTAKAENLEHTQQLLSSRRCPFCDLSDAGLVHADLSGAQLRGADLRNANLSRANLSGADLSGADLSGASLNGANLSGADLSGAMLTGTDLRDAYLVNANLTETDLGAAYLQGALGIPNFARTPEQFYRLGVGEVEKGNYQAAIDYYNQALAINTEYAPAYLGRAIARYRLGDEVGATGDAQFAGSLFEVQENAAGMQAAQNFVVAMQVARQPAQVQQSGYSIERVVGGIASLLLNFL